MEFSVVNESISIMIDLHKLVCLLLVAVCKVSDLAHRSLVSKNSVKKT